MTNRELETRYMHMKQTWKTLVEANVTLVDENKDLKARIEKAIEIINKSLQPKSDYVDYVYGSKLLRQELLDTLKGSDKE